jgi:hypothetical protein
MVEPFVPFRKPRNAKDAHDPLDELAPPRTRWDLLRALAAFGVTVACAVVLDWQAGDIAWGLWVSSIWIGYVTLAAAMWLEEIPLRRQAGTDKHLGFVLGFGAAFTVLFGGAHFLHCTFLNQMLPLDPHQGGIPNIFYLFARATWRYWAVVAMGLLARYGDLKRLLQRPGSHKALVLPFLTVARLHVMIAFLGLFSEWGIAHQGLFVALAGAFAPWGLILRRIIEHFQDVQARRLREAEKEFEDVFADAEQETDDEG